MANLDLLQHRRALGAASGRDDGEDGEDSARTASRERSRSPSSPSASPSPSPPVDQPAEHHEEPGAPDDLEQEEPAVGRPAGGTVAIAMANSVNARPGEADHQRRRPARQQPDAPAGAGSFSRTTRKQRNR